MSRLLIATSLIAALATYTFASQQRFAQPPPDVATQADLPAPKDYEERVVLDRTAVRAKLAANRAANLKRFRAYQSAGVFPSNTFEPRKLNVWKDADGHLCAAATIINASGMSDLVQRVADQSNFIRLADVKQGPLMDWILTSGLTQDEIAAIQEPFMPVNGDEPGVIDARRRAVETNRLREKYRSVEAMIVKNQKTSLELAVDRVMKRQDLAWNLVAN